VYATLFGGLKWWVSGEKVMFGELWNLGGD
jgi:hypothetical protein